LGRGSVYGERREAPGNLDGLLSFDDRRAHCSNRGGDKGGPPVGAVGGLDPIAAARRLPGRVDRIIEVVVVAPIRVHRESLAAALEAHANLKVVGKSATLDEGLGTLRDLQGPAVALLDGTILSELMLTMPLAGEPEPRLLAVGVPEDKAVAWIEAGAFGCIPPDGSLDDLVLALERVARNELVASSEVTAHLANRVRRLAAESPAAFDGDRLTARQMEIAELLAEGLSNKQIARRLSIEVQTVKNHVHHILAKLGVSRRSEAALRVHGLKRLPGGQPRSGT
jgi:two-component system nitrate/nitrite response regulator NarL